jgi:hypothetical protein
VHRDLKPDNVILVDRAGQKDFVKVLDFGIAKRSNEEDKQEQKLTQQGMVLGTPPYMSPEQFTGRPVDARSDIYSLGVMAYEMLTARLPYSANTPWEWATQHMTAAPVPIESLPEGMRAPPAMRSAIQRALAKSPAERFQTVKELNEAFGVGSAMRTSAGSLPGIQGDPLVGAPGYGPPPVGSPGYGPPTGGSPGYGPPTGGLPGYGLPPTGTAQYAAPPGNVGFTGPVAGATAGPPNIAPQGGRGLRIALIVGAVVAVLGGAITVVVLFVLPGPEPVRPAPARPVTAAPTHPAPTTPPPPPAPAPAPAPRPNTPYNGVECQRAREAHAAGKAAEAKEWGAACTAKGGTP